MAGVIRPWQPDIGGYGASHALPYGDLDEPQYLATRRKPMGMTEQGNVNLRDRPSVYNNGGYSTVYSMSFEKDGEHVLVPLVTDHGTIDTPEQAVDRHEQTGRHLGKFATAEMADAYAQELHLQQEAMFNQARSSAALNAFGVGEP